MNRFIVMGSVLMFAFLVSIFSGAVYATQASTDTEVELNVSTVINISTPDTTTINCASLNTLCTANTTITVGTNNITGYTLQLNATSGYSNSLTNAATSETIPTLSGAYAAGSFPTNYWGYTGGLDKSGETGGLNCSSNYCPILAYQSNDSNYAPNHAIKVTNAPANASATTITFGAKANITKSAGTYSTSVTFTAVTNAIPTPAMQDFDTTACANATTDQTITLRDSRDDTEYTVAKLQDGNCWMTQNLELGETGQSLVLNDSTSNVSSSGYTLTLNTNQSAYKGNSNKYGNFYTRSQAVAGSGLQVSGQDAPYDICPKGWRLPSASSASAADSEFYTMLNHYITTGTWGSANGRWEGTTTSEWTSPPISFVFSGYHYINSLGDQGSQGAWWSSTTRGKTGGSYYAYCLGASTNGTVGPRNESGQSYGLSIRCLIPGS